jgi:hypothetical protein
MKTALKALLDAGVTGAGGGGTPIRCMSNTSPRLDVGMCASFCAAILVLLVWMGYLLRGASALAGWRAAKIGACATPLPCSAPTV